MDLHELQAMGAFVTRKIFKREITVKFRPLRPEVDWEEPGNPEHEEAEVERTMTVYIRKASAADLLEIASVDDRNRPFVTIHRCICNADGSEVFPDLETASQLATWLLLPLFEIIKTVNPDTRKKSPPRTSSGARSRSLSAGKPSSNGKSKCPPMKPSLGDSTATSAAV